MPSSSDGQVDDTGNGAAEVDIVESMSSSSHLDLSPAAIEAEEPTQLISSGKMCTARPGIVTRSLGSKEMSVREEPCAVIPREFTRRQIPCWIVDSLCSVTSKTSERILME